MGLDWLDLARAVAAIGMAYGAYQGIQRMRENGTWSAAAYGLITAMQALYLGGGIVLVTLYGVYLAWDYLIIFIISAAFYLAGGFYLCWRLSALIHLRFPPIGAIPK